MSTYLVRLYTTSSKPDNNDHRLAVIGWKTPQAKKDDPTYKPAPTLCISIPRQQISCEPAILAAPLQAAWEGMQNELIRDLIEGTAFSQRIGLAISGEQISYTAVATHNAASAGRLKGETIETWFDAHLAEKLTVALADVLKLPSDATPEQLQRLNAAVSDHRLKLAKLAGPQTRYPEPVANGLLSALKLVTSETELTDKLRTKLESFKIAQPIELLASLG